MADGTLTSAQYEIMNVVWPQGNCGATIGHIWRDVAELRDVTRTTVANQVERLVQRGWLERRAAKKTQKGTGNRYLATTSRRRTAMDMAKNVVDIYFDGSATDFIMNFLKSRRPSANNVRQLKMMLKQNPENKLCRTELHEAFRLLLNEDASEQHQQLWSKMQKRNYTIGK